MNFLRRGQQVEGVQYSDRKEQIIKGTETQKKYQNYNKRIIYKNVDT